MSERIDTCPECNSSCLEVVKIHNPETTDMNCKASLKCIHCEHEWEGEITSPFHKKQRELGYRI